MTKGKKVTVLIVVIVFFVLISLAYLVFNNIGKIEVTISVAPKDSEILLDQTHHINPGNNFLSPGSHNIKIERTGFYSQSFNINVTADGANNLPIALTPKTDAAKTYLGSHSSDFIKIGDLSDSESNIITRSINKKYLLIKKLPIDISPLYIISYGPSQKYPNDPTKIAIIISSSGPASDQYAISTIYDKGYDPSDYEIIFESL